MEAAKHIVKAVNEKLKWLDKPGSASANGSALFAPWRMQPKYYQMCDVLTISVPLHQQEDV